MSKNNVSVRKFIQDYLIDQIGDIKNTNPYFAFLLMAVGIEFLGKCQNEHDWDDYKLIQPRDNFNNGLKIGTLKKYANKDFYDKLRNGLAHALLIKKGVKLSEGEYEDALNSNTLYQDFKIACNEVINAAKGEDGILRTSEGIEIKKDLDATFFYVSEKHNVDGDIFSITATTQYNNTTI